MAGGQDKSFLRGGEPSLRTRGLIASRSVHIVRHLRGSYIVTPWLSPQAVTPQKIQLIRHSSRSYARKSASQAILSRIRLTLHATCRTTHGVSPLVQTMPAWSVKTRHAPSWHCKDARTYDYTTTAMHDMGAPPLLRL